MRDEKGNNSNARCYILMYGTTDLQPVWCTDTNSHILTLKYCLESILLCFDRFNYAPHHKIIISIIFPIWFVWLWCRDHDHYVLSLCDGEMIIFEEKFKFFCASEYRFRWFCIKFPYWKQRVRSIVNMTFHSYYALVVCIH